MFQSKWKKDREITTILCKCKNKISQTNNKYKNSSRDIVIKL